MLTIRYLFYDILIFCSILVLVLVAQAWAESPRLQQVVIVYEGKISVGLDDADITDVLAKISEHSGIPIHFDSSQIHRVSILFSPVPLEEGIRRLLRLVHLNYAMRYAPNGRLQEVMVTGSQTEDPRVEAEAQQTDTPEVSASQQFADALRKHQAEAPAMEHDDNEAASSFVHALQHNSSLVSGGSVEPESDTITQFRDALNNAIQSPEDGSK